MKLFLSAALFLFLIGLCSCFPKVEQTPPPVHKKLVEVVPAPKPDSKKDRSLPLLVRYFEQADAIHREAWWVLTSERKPITKSPFGKVQRALMSYQNLKLANKSLFRCDRFVVNRNVRSLNGYPQNIQIFEKCSEKMEAKLIAEVDVPGSKELKVTFFPENLEEIVGLSASVINKSIICQLRGDGEGRLLGLNCQHWAQERTKEQMIRLETYEYSKAGNNLIQLRGKVFENLTEIRKLVADVPMEGKIEVLETELFPAPEVTPSPTPKPPPPIPTPAPKPAPAPVGPESEVIPEGVPPESLITPLTLPPPPQQIEGVQQVDHPEFIELPAQDAAAPVEPPPPPKNGDGGPRGR